MREMRPRHPGSMGMTLLGLARQAITEHPRIVLPNPAEVPAELREARAVFVTLTINGELRGCIGNFQEKPLFRNVMECAVSAGYADPRFRPLSRKELPSVRIEISILSPPAKLEFSSPEELLAKLSPERGVILRKGTRSATFLPQVWEQLPDKEEFLDHLSQKAGLAADAWRQPGVEIDVYTVEKLKEINKKDTPEE